QYLLYGHCHHQHLHSFPTRRSSDLLIRRKVGEQNALYGSVTNSDIADELAKKGFEIEKRKIQMDDHIKHIGDYEIPLRLFKDVRSEEHTSELQSRENLVCRLLLEKK